MPKTKLKRKLKDWNWKKNFSSLEEATEFLLDYCTELGPLAQECVRRIGKNKEVIKQLTLTNKNLRGGTTTNDRFNQNRN
tara:strand:+ start:674 stop:913 length:240 start_codon:yes stop_codon:yes gene_type:complete